MSKPTSAATRHVRTALTAHPRGASSADGANPITPLKSKPQRPPFSPQALLHFTYHPHPTALHNNPTLLHPTTLIASDPSHPFHTRTLRRLAAFNPHDFHLRVQCPADVSKKAFLRNWAAKRVKRALVEGLRERGWGVDGRGIVVRREGEEGDGDGEGRRQGISGALLVVLTRDKLALTASEGEVRESVGWVLRCVVRLRREAAAAAEMRLEDGGPSGGVWSGDEVEKVPRLYEQRQQRRPFFAAAHLPVTAGGEIPPRFTPRQRQEEPRNEQHNSDSSQSSHAIAPIAPSPSTGAPVPQQQTPEEIEAAIRLQIEQHFSHPDLPRDTHPLSLSGGGSRELPAKGPTSLRKLAGFRRVKMLGQPLEVVRRAVQGSEVLEVGEGDVVSRRVPMSLEREKGLGDKGKGMSGNGHGELRA